MLEKVDSKYAKKISVNDKTRILRALEVFMKLVKIFLFIIVKKSTEKIIIFIKYSFLLLKSKLQKMQL